MKSFVTFSAIVLGLVLQAGNVSASAFRVTPIRVVLERGSASALLTLSNESGDTLRFQISASSWSQGADGTMRLEPTTDILFFPALLSLGPGEERKVRVSSKAQQGPVEKTYRIFFEELPPLKTPETDRATQVRILTKMGVPIFVSPTSVTERVSIGRARVEQGRLRFSVRNEGTVRFGVTSVQVRGLGANQETLFENQLDGWYVLAGGERTYDVELPADLCPKLQRVLIEVRTDSAAASAGSATTAVEASNNNCK